jgi:hypothetical protein
VRKMSSRTRFVNNYFNTQTKRNKTFTPKLVYSPILSIYVFEKRQTPLENSPANFKWNFIGMIVNKPPFVIDK